jgi:hypothetical protein
MGKFLIILLLAGAITGLYYVNQDYQRKLKRDRNPWPERVAEAARGHTARHYMASVTGRGGESSLLQLLYLAHEIGRDGYPLPDNLRSGVALAGAGANEAAAIVEALMDNYQRALDLGVFGDPANILRMERGERPVAAAAGWEGEPLTVGYKISPLLGPELGSAIPNMVVMPEAARNLQTDLCPPDAELLVNQWLAAGLISAECVNAVRQKVQDDKRLR